MRTWLGRGLSSSSLPKAFRSATTRARSSTTLQLTDALENVVSNEEDVKGVVAKVALGEAEAGFVYATDAATAGARVGVIELPKGSQPPIEYQIAVVKGSANKQAAEAFVQKVLAPEGQQALASAGFLRP